MESDLSGDRKQDLLVMTTFFFARFFGMEIVQEDIQMSLFEPNPLAEYYEQRGLQKGKQEGKQEGIQEGLQKGKQEIVLRMLGREMPPQVVAELTGLSLLVSPYIPRALALGYKGFIRFSGFSPCSGLTNGRLWWNNTSHNKKACESRDVSSVSVPYPADS
ncbi:hypothetical protein L6R29_15810 [Myxococcota bacterium]|nr:hypothetical protein [Myxococcota bacterium]